MTIRSSDSDRRRPLLMRFVAILCAAICGVSGMAAIDLRPQYLSLQSGGGMGAFAAGTGWGYGKDRRWETELFLGVVPKHDSGSSKAVMTLKENYVPWRIQAGSRLTVRPLSASLYVTSILSKHFWVSQPDRYPPRYYGLPTKLRINISVGQRLDWHMRHTRHLRTLTAYYELGTCDVYLLSAFGNSSVGLADRLMLTLGVRASF